MNRDSGRGQTFGREYGRRDPYRSDEGFGGQGGEDMAGRNMGGQGWVRQGGQPPQGWRRESLDETRAGEFGRDLGRRGMARGHAHFGETREAGESMFGPGGLGHGGFGASSFGLGGRYREERSFSGQSHRGHGPKGYARSDERIREDVCEALTADDRLDASEIEVEVREGEVTLNGHVHARQDKRRADDLVENVGGVRYVQNNLRVERRDWAGFSTAPGR
ncbi:MAG TPA: BON domain-containing protein [Caulobacteraceae bacterium]|nr:BON domain-containing protein [Caulobacteraceae bacterium]